MRKKRNINLLLCVIILNLFINTKNNVNNQMVINIKSAEYNHSIPINNTYFAKLEIPVINLEEYLVSINNKNNNINKNIEILFPSKMPNISNSTLILAAHSGNSKVSYFKDLDKLQLNDMSKIYYRNNIYIYKVVKIDRQNKNGYITIPKIKNKSILILTTCDQKDKSKQLVITLKLI